MSNQNDRVFVSPFLNFDPSILVTNPNDQYIRLEGTDERSRFERSCCEIGGMVVTGGLIGSFYGMTKALLDKNIKTLPNKSIQRVQILNHITKTGGGMAQRFGSLGLIYAISDAAIQYSGVNNDNVTTVAAATTTGLIYGSANLSKGWRRPVIGSGVGFMIGLSIVGISNLDQFKMFMGRILNY